MSNTNFRNRAFSDSFKLMRQRSQRKDYSRTIKTAVKNLPKPVARQIVNCFNSCGCMDLYDGNLESYLKVINQNLRETKHKLNTVIRKNKQAEKQIKKYLIID